MNTQNFHLRTVRGIPPLVMGQLRNIQIAVENNNSKNNNPTDLRTFSKLLTRLRYVCMDNDAANDKDKLQRCNTRKLQRNSASVTTRGEYSSESKAKCTRFGSLICSGRSLRSGDPAGGGGKHVTNRICEGASAWERMRQSAGGHAP